MANSLYKSVSFKLLRVWFRPFTKDLSTTFVWPNWIKTNQNILLEAKLTTVMTDFNDEKTQLAAQALEWQEKYENLAAEVEAE